MTESTLYQNKLKPFLTGLGIFYHRIEHARIPDLYLSKSGVVVWVELKVINKQSSILLPEWRPGQLSWIKSHSNLGGNIFSLCLGYEGGFAFLPPSKQYTEQEFYSAKEERFYGLEKYFSRRGPIRFPRSSV